MQYVLPKVQSLPQRALRDILRFNFGGWLPDKSSSIGKYGVVNVRIFDDSMLVVPFTV